MVGVLTQFRWTPLVPKPGDEVTFTDDLGNIVKIDFGDGRFTTDKLPVKHVFVKDGKFKVTAISSDPVGNVGVETKEITVAVVVVPPVDPSVPPVDPPVVPPSPPGYFANLISALVAFLKSIFGIKI